MVNFDNFWGLSSVLKFHIFLIFEIFGFSFLTMKNWYVFVSSAKDWFDFFLKCEELVLNFHKCEEPVPVLYTQLLLLFDFW